MEALPDGGDNHVAFGLTVVAHALYVVDLSQLVDYLPVLSVHGREAVAPLGQFTLKTGYTHTQTRHSRLHVSTMKDCSELPFDLRFK